MRLSGVEVEVTAEFGGPGEPARRITYTAGSAVTPGGGGRGVAGHIDRVAEVQNTLRADVAVELHSAPAPVSLRTEPCETSLYSMNEESL